MRTLALFFVTLLSIACLAADAPQTQSPGQTATPPVQVAAEKPAGEWQHIDLTLYKRHLTVKLNGVKIIENKPIAGVTPLAINADEMSPGPILLQGERSNASFRNRVLTPILK